MYIIESNAHNPANIYANIDNNLSEIAYESILKLVIIKILSNVIND